MSRKARAGSLKGTHRLARGAFRNGLLEGVLGRQIHGNPEEIRKTVLKADHIEQGQMLLRVEFGDQIDIGTRGPGAAGERTVQAQMDNTGSLQLRLVLTQFCDHKIPVHTCKCAIVFRLRQAIDADSKG